MKRNVPPHDPKNPFGLQNPDDEGPEVVTLEAPLTQQPTSPFGCVACGGGWAGVVLADRRGRMWHASCAEGALAAFERVNETRGALYQVEGHSGLLFKVSLIDNLVTEELEERLNLAFGKNG